MKLRRIRIENFRKLEGPVELPPLGDGLTVVSGANEEGKSTLLAALRAALFEPHGVGGQVRQRMAPLSGATPAIELDFEREGRRYRLTKAFRRGGCTLEDPEAGTLKDDAAEERLKALFGFERRTAQQPRPENEGLQAIFWVEQGSTFAVPAGADDPVRLIRDQVGGAFDDELAAATSGGLAARLADDLQERLGALQTQTGKPRGRLRELQTELAALAERLSGLQERKRQLEADIDRLAALRAEARRARERDELGEARAAVRRLEEEVEIAGRLGAEIEARKGALNRAVEQRSEAQRWADERKRLREEVARLTKQAQASAERLTQAEAAYKIAEADYGAADKADVAAAEALKRAEAGERRRQKRAERQALVRQCAQLRRQVEDLRAVENDLRAAEVARGQGLVTPQQVEALRKAAREEETARAALELSATRIRLMPRGEAAATCDGKVLPARSDIPVDRRMVLDLAGFGQIEIEPGGDRLAERRQRHAQARGRLDALLEEMACPDLATAEARATAWQDLTRQIERAEARRQAVLGAADVRDLAALETRLVGLEEMLAKDELREDPEDATPSDSPAGEAEQALDMAREAAVLAAEKVRLAERALAERERERALLRQESESLMRQADEAGRRLQAAEQAQPEEQLNEQLKRLSAVHDRLMAELEPLERKMVALDLEALEDRLARARRAHEQVRNEESERQTDIIRLEAALRAAGADGIGEEIAALSQEIEAGRAEQRDLERERQALALVLGELVAARKRLQERYLAPVKEAVMPHLVRLFADGELLLDPENLSPSAIRRGGVEEPFGQLSVGTREQIAVLVRLALAELMLRQGQEPPCIILDDALVYADEGRFETMKTILQKAAAHLQIIILTCRPRDYRGLDAAVIRLEDCVSAAR